MKLKPNIVWKLGSCLKCHNFLFHPKKSNVNHSSDFSFFEISGKCLFSDCSLMENSLGNVHIMCRLFLMSVYNHNQHIVQISIYVEYQYYISSAFVLEQKYQHLCFHYRNLSLAKRKSSSSSDNEVCQKLP